MAKAAPEDAPEPDRREGAPHPREAAALFGHAGPEAEALHAIRSGRLHSGWLLAGPEGVGKATFAYRMAGTLLARRPGAPPPEHLGLHPDHPDARLIRAGAHPRLFVLRRSLNDEGRMRAQVAVEDARRLGDFLHMSAPDGGQRAVIVDAADDLNPSSANAILKLLEEPPPRTTLLLVAHQPARLLPTIRSRCRTLRLAPLGAPDLAAALRAIGVEPEDPGALAELAGGSVGAAVRLAEDGGLALYGEVARLAGTLPRLDRPAALRLAEGAAAKGDRLALLLDLLDLLLARLARAGVAGPPPEAAPGEAAILARLSPHARAPRGGPQAWRAGRPTTAPPAPGPRSRPGRAPGRGEPGRSTLTPPTSSSICSSPSRTRLARRPQPEAAPVMTDLPLPGLVDSHCHLDFPDLAPDLDAVVARARAAGVGRMVTICTRLRHEPQVRAIAERFTGDDPAHPVLYAAGTHPMSAAEEPMATVEQLVEIARHPLMVGIGETGLDYHYSAASKAQQQASLRVHVEAAQETGLPLIIHARDADEDVERLLAEGFARRPYACVMHCFSSGERLARAALEMGFYLSVSGIAAFPRSADLRAILARAPLDRILVETDSPYLAPPPHRGRRNEPAFVAHTARAAAGIWGVSEHELREATTANFDRLFAKASARAPA